MVRNCTPGPESPLSPLGVSSDSLPAVRVSRDSIRFPCPLAHRAVCSPSLTREGGVGGPCSPLPVSVSVSLSFRLSLPSLSPSPGEFTGALTAGALLDAAL